MDEDALKVAVAKQPVSVAVEADKSAFQLYKSGVMSSPFCGKKLDHGVLIVGYGKAGFLGEEYWKGSKKTENFIIYRRVSSLPWRA